MIGRTEESGALDFDLSNRPRHSARRPPTEMTHRHRRRIRFAASFGAIASASASTPTATTISGIGPRSDGLRRRIQGAVSLPAAGMGRRGRRSLQASRAWPGSASVGSPCEIATARGWSRFGRPRLPHCGFSVAVAVVVATGATTVKDLPAPLPSRQAGQAATGGRRRLGSGLPGVGAGAESIPCSSEVSGKTAGRDRCSTFRSRMPAACLAVAIAGDRLDAAPGASDRPLRPGRAAIRSTTGWRAPRAPPRRPRQRPTIRAATARGGRRFFLGQKAAQHAAGILGFEAAT